LDSHLKVLPPSVEREINSLGLQKFEAVLKKPTRSPFEGDGWFPL